MTMFETLAVFPFLLTCLRFANTTPLYDFDENYYAVMPEVLADSNACQDERDCSWIRTNIGEGEKLKKYCNLWKHKKAIQECRETCNLCKKAPSPVGEKAPSPIACQDERDCSWIRTNIGEGEERKKYCNHWKHTKAIQECRETCNLCKKAPSPIACEDERDCSWIRTNIGEGEKLKKYCNLWKHKKAIQECRKTCNLCHKPPSPTIKPETAKPETKMPTEKVTEQPTEKPINTQKPTQPSGETPSGFQKACLEAHNDFRYFHGVPLLKWSAKLSRDAQNWANHLAASGKFDHDPTARDKDQGENLYYTTHPKKLCAYGEQGPDCLSCEEIVQLWYDEEANYDYNTGKAKRAGEEILHFTQIIWKASRELGMATAVANNRLVAVARYSPVGNVDGKFKENVPPPINVP